MESPRERSSEVAGSKRDNLCENFRETHCEKWHELKRWQPRTEDSSLSGPEGDNCCENHRENHGESVGENCYHRHP